MSLDVTILKTHHCGIEEAEKLRPYIEQADFFCVEIGCSTFERSDFFEKEWGEVLRDPTLTPQDFDSDYFSQDYVEENPSTSSYTERFEAILFENKVPIVLLERFDNFMSTQLVNVFESEYDSMMKEGWHEYIYGSKEDGLNRMLKAKDLYFWAIKERDENIAGNIPSCLDRARETYGDLFPNKDTLNLGIQIGALHNIENFYKGPCSVVTLTELDSQSTTIGDIYMKSLQRGFVPERDAYPKLDKYLDSL